jgi:hypothetical protein
VTLTAPKAGATWAATVTLAASASDPSGVTAVKWYVDGREIAYDGSGTPWTATYNTRALVNGSHIVFAKARDRLGNWATSPTATVRVAN